jgi:hypothetical protein
VPWLQAKVMAIFIALNVLAHEEQFGPLLIPDFLFNQPLKKFGNRQITLEEIFREMIKDHGAPSQKQD